MNVKKISTFDVTTTEHYSKRSPNLAKAMEKLFTKLTNGTFTKLYESNFSHKSTHQMKVPSLCRRNRSNRINPHQTPQIAVRKSRDGPDT